MRPDRLRFLIVDDFATARRIMRNLLREIGCGEADEAVDGRVALEMLQRDRYDFVIADVDMPRLNGFDLIDAMRHDPALQPIPALLVTREASKEQVIRASRVGASGYVVRPLTRAGLEDKICSILGVPALGGSRRYGLARPSHDAPR
jgi:two-component system, chemotaxis family, chemotaxis protein CheY